MKGKQVVTKAIDKVAFNAIYKDKADGVYQTALHYSGNNHAAEEIVQAVFVKLYLNMDNVNEKAIGSWLLTTARNMAINCRRGLKREVLTEDIECCEFEDVTDAYNLEDDFIKKICADEYRDLAKKIFTELYHFNPRWYEAVTITYFLEKPQKEVAEIMGVKIEVLHSILYRAKKWIKKNYEEQFEHLSEE